MSSLEHFVGQVPNFQTLDTGSQIKYFGYFKLFIEGANSFKAKDISAYYEQLHLNPYSNISQYLSNNSKKTKTQQFLKVSEGYKLLAQVIKVIQEEIGQPKEHQPSNSLFPLEIFDNTRHYLSQFSKEAAATYDLALYNSCLFMIRKITETLIIELYERKGLQSKIKNSNGDYLQLSDLIKNVSNEPSWKLTKIVKEQLPKIKLLADSSVHSKRFSAKKPDIENMKVQIRITFEELINHIDYPNWTNK